MNVTLHPHAKARLAERGATESRGRGDSSRGRTIPGKVWPSGFRRNFSCQSHWRGKFYATKQIIAFAASAPDGWLVITLIVKYY